MTEDRKSYEEGLRIAPQGEMTVYTAMDWKQKLMAPFALLGEIEIDLSAVEEMDSTGLQLLILVKKEASAQGRTLRLIHHSRPILEALDLCGLTDYLDASTSNHSAGA